MYCTKCGANNPDDGTYCHACGAPLTIPVPPPPPPAPLVPKRTSGLAVASLVLGIVGFVTVGLTSALAIIFGGIAISQTAKDRALEGRGMATAGLVLGIVVIALWLLFLALAVVGSVAAFEVDSLSA